MSGTLTLNRRLPTDHRPLFGEKAFSLPALTNTFVQLWGDISYRSNSAPQDTFVDILDMIYRFSDYVAVSSFLRKNGALVQLLLEAVIEVPKYFGQDVNMSVEVETEGEYENAHKLYLLIHPNADDIDSAYAALELLDHEWWLQAHERANFKMNVDLEF